MTLESAVILGIISFIGNIYQYYTNKKGRDLDAIKQEFELFKELQKSKDEGYAEALKAKELQIKMLTADIESQKAIIEANTSELKKMQKTITFLIANGCQECKTCPDHCPYSLDDLGKIINANEED